MPRRFQANALVAVVGFTVVACESGSSTKPTPTSPATNLAGAWVRTASVSWEDGGGCSGPVTVTFAQTRSAVSATLPEVAGCIDEPLRFEGTLTGNVLQGSIVFPTFTWRASGQASERHV